MDNRKLIISVEKKQEEALINGPEAKEKNIHMVRQM